MPYCLQCGHATQSLIPEGDSRLRDVCPHCGYIHYNNPKVICGALVTDGTHAEDPQAKVLLCRRAIEPRYGYWTLPAGFMELNETTEQGAARETWEEAEAELEAPQLYCVYDVPSIGQVYTLYRATLKNGAFGAGEESLECALFSEHEIPWQDLAFPSVSKTLELYFADRQAGTFPIRTITLSR